MLAQSVVAGVPRALLASGLESRQVAELAALWSAHAAWAVGAALDGEAVRTVVADRLLAMSKALAALPADDEDVRLESAIDGGVRVLAACGLDLHAALAGARAAVESETEAMAVVVVGFDAYGRRQSIAIKVAWTDGSWQVAADSPLRRWIEVGPGMGGPGRPPRRDRPSDGEPPAADDAKTPAGGF